MPDVNAESENNDAGIYARADVFSTCNTPYFRTDIEMVSKQRKVYSGCPSEQETEQPGTPETAPVCETLNVAIPNYRGTTSMPKELRTYSRPVECLKFPNLK